MEECTALINGNHIERHQPDEGHHLAHNEAIPHRRQAAFDVDEAWDHFEITRRSAEFYMNSYFKHLEARSARQDSNVHIHMDLIETQAEQIRDEGYWYTKAARDCLVRDLKDMSFWMEQLALSQKPEVKTPAGVAVLSTTAITFMQHFKSEALLGILGLGQLTAIATLVSSVGYLLHVVGRQSLHSFYQESVAECLDAAQNWTLKDRHRRMVKRSQYQLLGWPRQAISKQFSSN